MALNKETLDKVRNIEGFPIGKDEDIIKLSNPPYYTVCPNPFINEFIEKNGKPYDEENDDYNIEPYTADVSEGKNDPIYNAHTYHTKVPYKAIMKYILHYTKPGEIVFDGFCGTGMTGVAAQMCGRLGQESKKALVDEFKREGLDIKWGARNAILNDLSPAATFIAYNFNTPVDLVAFTDEINKVLNEVEKDLGWMYETEHIVDGKVQYDITGKMITGKINYTVWSDVFLCPNCASEIVFWNDAVNKDEKQISEHFHCHQCGSIVTKTGLERAYENTYDLATEQIKRVAKQLPVLINYSVGKGRYEKAVDKNDTKLLEKINPMVIPVWYPSDPMMFKGERWGDSWRAGIHSGITNVHHFYTKRNLYILSIIYSKIKYNSKALLVFQSIAVTLCSKLARYNMGNRGNGPVSGTLYIASLTAETNIFNVFRGKFDDFRKAFSLLQSSNNSIVSCGSCSDLQNIKSSSVDYVFTDPPFGDNLMYSELNFLWEAWLRVITNTNSEAIINKSQKKHLSEYQGLMEKSFLENYRILKPGRWMTVEFHNSQNSVWNAIQEAILKAGFVIANVKTLDKRQGSFKQVTTTSAVKQDLIISSYKPKESFVERFLKEAGTEEGVWDFIREHLEKLPVVVENNDMIDIVPERQNYLLYDCMVAFHIQKGATVPLGAADFYLGLKQRFPERDGMYFLPGQVSIYDAKRIIQELNEQLSLFVLDEKTAIQWLHKELEIPQTYQDVQPKFLQELKQIKYEKMPELRDLLEENFLQDENGKWYVPDVNKQSDLEKLRDKKLLKEFDEYRSSKGKLKVFRTEAIRAGFKHCWKEKDYKTIVNIGERMPESVVQEDPSILMYYDNALTRIGD